jgi:hypothetical protein
VSRVYITSPVTFYVNNVTGNDANDGSTPALAWKTIQHAVDELQEECDFAAQPTIQLATTGADYNENVTLGRYVGSLCYPAGGAYTYPRILGDPTNNNAVAIHPTAGAAFTSVNGSPWILDSLRVCSNNHYCVVCDAHAHLLLRNLNFGCCGLGHMIAEYGGFIETLAGPYTISGGAPYHITALMRGEYVSQGNAISFTAPYGAWPYFGYFAQGGSGGLVAAGGISLAGGGYTCGHTNQANNDGSALMYPMANGTWP